MLRCRAVPARQESEAAEKLKFHLEMVFDADVRCAAVTEPRRAATRA
jgi:hypothetical protein